MTISPISPFKNNVPHQAGYMQNFPAQSAQSTSAQNVGQQNAMQAPKKEPIISSHGLVILLLHLGAFLTVWALHRKPRLPKSS